MYEARTFAVLNVERRARPGIARATWGTMRMIRDASYLCIHICATQGHAANSDHRPWPDACSTGQSSCCVYGATNRYLAEVPQQWLRA